MAYNTITGRNIIGKFSGIIKISATDLINKKYQIYNFEDGARRNKRLLIIAVR